MLDCAESPSVASAKPTSISSCAGPPMNCPLPCRKIKSLSSGNGLLGAVDISDDHSRSLYSSNRVTSSSTNHQVLAAIFRAPRLPRKSNKLAYCSRDPLKSRTTNQLVRALAGVFEYSPLACPPNVGVNLAHS